MTHPLGFIHRMLLPFYAPATIAKILIRKTPMQSALVLETLPVERSLSIIRSFEDPSYALKILNVLSDYLYSLSKSMSLEELSHYMITLQGGTVRRLSLRIADSTLGNMMPLWDETKLQVILTNVHPKKGGYILEKLEGEKQVKVLRSLQTWVQAALIKDMSPNLRAEVIDGLSLEAAVDLLTRWGFEIQSEVVRIVKKSRRTEIFNAMRPKQISEILNTWPDEDQIDVLNGMKEDQMINVLFNLHDDSKKSIFQLLPPIKQKFVIANLQAKQAVNFLKYLEDDEANKILNELDDDTSRLLIKAIEKMETN